MPEKKKPARTNKRTEARRCALQALYQWEIAGASAEFIEQEFIADRDMSDVDVSYFRQLVSGVLDDTDALDKQLAICLDRAIGGLDPVERSILRLGTFELIHYSKVPVGVVINEAIELAKTFGGEQGHRYVNGVLDKLAKTLRKTEKSKV